MNSLDKTLNESAVSPVVGVMLMLVVVIIIAAVVSAFAGGMGSGQKVTPSASISVRIDTAMDDTMGGTTTKMVFEHLSGDPIRSQDIKIITYYTAPNGTVIKHIQDASSPVTQLYSSLRFTRVPFLNDPKVGRSGYNTSVDFGNFIWSTGDLLSTGSPAGTSALLGFDVSDTSYGFRAGVPVDVKILHTPSNKYIFDKEVFVQ